MPFPQFQVFQRVTADLLNQMTPTSVVKVSTTSVTSNATPANDPELSNIALGVGTWSIEGLYFAGGITAGGLRMQWAFSGTLGNTPVRTNIGPGPGNTANPNAVSPPNLGISNYTTAVQYGLSTTAANFFVVQEYCEEFQVTAAGNFSVQWSQWTSNATATTLRTGSRIRYKQIA